MANEPIIPFEDPTPRRLDAEIVNKKHRACPLITVIEKLLDQGQGDVAVIVNARGEGKRPPRPRQGGGGPFRR